MATKRYYRNGLSTEINHYRLEPEIKTLLLCWDLNVPKLEYLSFKELYGPIPLGHKGRCFDGLLVWDSRVKVLGNTLSAVVEAQDSLTSVTRCCLQLKIKWKWENAAKKKWLQRLPRIEYMNHVCILNISTPKSSKINLLKIMLSNGNKH